MPRFLKLENNIVVNVEVHESQPSNTDAFTYQPVVGYTGMGWEWSNDEWVNPNSSPFNPKRLNADGVPTKWMDSTGTVEEDEQGEPSL